MKEKDELLQIFPTPVLITKYEEDISEETKYIENLEYLSQKDNKNFKSKDSYLMKHEVFKIFCVYLFKLCKIKSLILDNSLCFNK